MTIAQAREANRLLVEEKWIEAANYALEILGKKATITTQSQALSVMRGLFQWLLDHDEYLAAATLQWGSDVFNAEPESVVRVFRALHDKDLSLLMGASSMSKSYAAGAWMLLDYLRDPQYTSVKLAAVSEKHLRENLFPHVVNLWRNLSIPVAAKIENRDSDMWMGIRDAGFEFGISGIAFKQSQETSGQFKGYKSKPVRKKPHPKFGFSSRLRVLLDEGQNVPGGPFQDFNSLVASIDTASSNIKLVIAFNPENMSCKAVQMAEPPDGWQQDQLETLYDYESKAGWWVTRLDAARCENVIQGKIIYRGLQTKEGYLSYLKSGGDNSAAYICFGRGFPPIKGSVSTIIQPSWPQEARGEATFIETPITLGAVDLAFIGKDSAQMAVARWGLASGWRNQHGVFETFKDRLNPTRERPRHVLQIDQILPLDKHDDAGAMATEIMAKCKTLGIKPEWLAIDKTGIGYGTYTYLARAFGDLYGVSWNEKATETKIISDDNEGANSQCDGIMSEMWWAFRRWLDPRCKAILINPIIPSQPIHTQLTSRRYKTGKNGIKVESKEEYKARNAQASPDEADAMMMLPQLIRLRSDTIPGLVEEKKRQDERPEAVDPIKFIPVKEMVSIEHDDVMEMVGEEGRQGEELEV
jgi:hypothetical protein